MPNRARPRFVALVLALITAAAVPLLGGTAAAASVDEQLTWGIRPADGAAGANRSALTLEGAPGARRSDAVSITNYSDRALTLDVYATEAGLAADGSATAGAQGDALPGSSVDWVEVSVDRVEVPAGSAVSVPFTVVLPFDAEPGDHAFALLTSLAGEGDVAVERRLGIRGYVRVGGELAPSIEVSQVGVSSDLPADPFAARDGSVEFVVTNTGNVRLTSTAEVVLRDLVGREMAWMPAPDERTDAHVWDAGVLPVLGPGDSVRVVVPMADVEAPLIAVRAEVKVTAAAFVDPGSVLEPVHATAWMLAVAWPVLVLIGLLLAIAAVLVVRAVRRRRARAAPAADEAAAAPQPEHVGV